MVCWLACALPLQGIAAVAMLHCAPAHSRAALAMPADHAAHGHGADHAPAAADTGAHAQHAQPAEDGSGNGAHACSACAQCSTGSALPSRAVALPVWPTAAQKPAAWPDAPAGIVPGGLERPPRSLLA